MCDARHSFLVLNDGHRRVPSWTQHSRSPNYSTASPTHNVPLQRLV